MWEVKIRNFWEIFGGSLAGSDETTLAGVTLCHFITIPLATVAAKRAPTFTADARKILQKLNSCLH